MLSGEGDILREGQVATTKVGMTEMFGRFGRFRIAIEVGTHSPCVSRLMQHYTRCTVDLLTPSAFAIFRHDQWVEPSVSFCCVLRAIRACTLASATRG
jgi:hypothetical protein